MSSTRSLTSAIRVGQQLTTKSAACLQQHRFVANATTFNKQQNIVQIQHKNITLKHCIPIASHQRSHATQPPTGNEVLQHSDQSQRPLAVLLTWLAANEKHIEKYRGIWFQRGFDVLTVKMTPYQFLIPKYGAKHLISDLLKFLTTSAPYYPDVILHCFSVGAYEYGEMLTQLKNKEQMKAICDEVAKQDPTVREFGDPSTLIQSSIKAIILDSPVNFHGIESGVSRSITSNPLAVKLLENAIRGHMFMAHRFATKYYIEASDNAHYNAIKVPALMMVSKKDPIGTPEMSENLIKCWDQLGIDSTLKCFNNSGHVQHYSKHPEEYCDQVDRLLSKVNFVHSP